MADPKRPDVKHLLKLTGGILFMIWAVVLLIHRFPKMGYVDIIPDAPKPPPVAAAAAAPSQAPGPKPAVKAQVTPTALLISEAPAVRPLNLEDACEMEIGILCCCRLPIKEVQSCLASYEEGLRKNCLRALDQRRTGAR